MIATDQGRMELGAWIEAYGRAWETGDDDLMASLFTEDANYRSAPFREPFRGHDAMWGMSEAGEWVMRGPDEISEWWIRHPSSSR